MTIDMLRDVLNEFGNFLLCIGESASAILRHGCTYYMYDPHSRNSHGFPDANGASILLTFNSFNKLSNYFTYLAMNLNTDQFELTPMKIVVGVPDYYMEHTRNSLILLHQLQGHCHLSYQIYHPSVQHISIFYICYHNIRYIIML